MKPIRNTYVKCNLQIIASLQLLSSAAVVRAEYPLKIVHCVNENINNEQFPANIISFSSFNDRASIISPRDRISLYKWPRYQ